jgi:hypothetical protein
VEHEALVGVLELELLARGVGNPVDSVWADHWSATAHTPDLALLVIPEEVHTPTTSHPYADVDRPAVELCHERRGMGELVGRDLGIVREITLLRALVSFSEVVECPETEIEILGRTIPPGEGYSIVFLDPAGDARGSAGLDAPVVVADIGIELATDRRRTITFFTRAVGYCVETVLDEGLPRDLLPYVRRHTVAIV